ncbi:uncharacterized protein K452DRAFT_210615, partial [Aplosporella prunicola CBS 121167]
KWLVDGKEILNQGLKQFSGCFQVFTGVGPKIVIPNRFADEIRNDPHMNFGKALSDEFFGKYPGFEPFNSSAESTIVADMVRGKLTRSLGLILDELSDESSKSIKYTLGEPEEWTEIPIKLKIIHLISRLSARVFIGEELCENEEWLTLTENYTINAFIAARELREWPTYIRPIIHWFLPECRQVRRDIREARQIIMPVVGKRRERNRKAQEAGQPTSKVADTIGWLDEAAKGRPYDVAIAQLGISIAAIHTSSELLTGIMLDLCANPEYFKPLRDEMYTVLGEKGWRKTSLFEMRLLDSVMKESQRHHFGDIASMSRFVEQPITLSDGTTIPRGALTVVAIDRMHDTSIFPESTAYKGRRFLDMRQQPGNENKWQFVTTSAEHLAFGHGKHACPGRFFASNEIKVALCHLLLKYDWKLPNEDRLEDKIFGQEAIVDPDAKVLFRKRIEEV